MPKKPHNIKLFKELMPLHTRGDIFLEVISSTTFTKKNLYIEENDGKCFISIDMKKANFSALRHFSNEIFNGCSNWEDYLKHFTGITSILNSKYIRQVILGACNPGRQIKYEHYLMAILANHIKFSLPDVSVYSLGEDEIILEYDYKSYEKAKLDLQMLNDVILHSPQGVGDLVRITFFRLHQFSCGWYKEDLLDENAEPEFKCVDAEIYHQVVKHFFGRKITTNDLVFYHNGRLARFLEAIENPWKT